MTSMIASLLVATAAQATPARAVYAYTGLPTFTSDQGAVEVRSHSVTMTVKNGIVEGVSTTEVRNPSEAAAKVELRLPIKGYAVKYDAPMVNVTATWGNRPLILMARGGSAPASLTKFPAFWSGAVAATVDMLPRSTTALRITFRVPLGIAGLDRKLRVVGYDLSGGQAIGLLNIAIKYDEREVFGLPKMVPAEGWQVGAKGAFLRVPDFTPRDGAVLATFYPGGF